MNRLKLANEFVKHYRQQVITTYQPGYHITPPVGWMNDPNGFSYYKGEYHLFYQYHPYFAKWGPMHWAHLKSKDMVQWEWCPIALAPDEAYELSGCFSGTAIEDQGAHVLMYTSHLMDVENDTGYRQQQCLAVSYDGIHYEKVADNPVITTEEIPTGASKQDFRDPKVWKENDSYYCIIASRASDGNGQTLLYTSSDLHQWAFKGVICKSDGKIGGMWECPDLFQLDGQDILTLSPMFLAQRNHEFTNIYSSIYAIGQLDLLKPEFQFEHFYEIDYGLDFYAPQTIQSPDGRRIMIAWMQTWERNYPTEEMKHNWACAFTIPRELNIVNDRLIQQPIRELKDYRLNEVQHTNKIVQDKAMQLKDIKGHQLELELTVDLHQAKSFGIELFCSEKESVLLKYDVTRATFAFDRGNLKTKMSGWEKHQVDGRVIPVTLENNQLYLHIFLDVSTIEIFINGGKYVMSSTVFPQDQGQDIRFISEGTSIIHTLSQWDLKIK